MLNQPLSAFWQDICHWDAYIIHEKHMYHARRMSCLQTLPSTCTMMVHGMLAA